MLHKVKYATPFEYASVFCEWSNIATKKQRIEWAAGAAKRDAKKYCDKCIELVSIDDKLLTPEEQLIARSIYR